MAVESEKTKRPGTVITEIAASLRAECGARACRRLRRQGQIPANLYGHKEANVFLTVREGEFTQHLTAGRRLVKLNFGDVETTGMIKEVQYDSLGDRIIHVDFARIALTERVHLRVPIVTMGTAKGAVGGLFEVLRKELDIEGPATEIPERIELVVSAMVVGDVIRVKEVPLPPSCKVLHAEADDVVVAVHVPRKIEEVKPAEVPAEGAGTGPEVIGKAKEAAEGAAPAPGKKEGKEVKEGKKNE